MAVAAALSPRPEVLLLDEPTTGQDPPQVARVMSSLHALLATPSACGAVLFTTHDLRAVAQFATRVLVLGEGRLLADCAPNDLLRDDALLCRAGLRRAAATGPRDLSVELPAIAQAADRGAHA